MVGGVAVVVAVVIIAVVLVKAGSGDPSADRPSDAPSSSASSDGELTVDDVLAEAEEGDATAVIDHLTGPGVIIVETMPPPETEVDGCADAPLPPTAEEIALATATLPDEVVAAAARSYATALVRIGLLCDTGDDPTAQVVVANRAVALYHGRLDQMGVSL